MLAGCSVERKNPLSKAYHNTTAHYNGYFLAREKLKAIEAGIQSKVVYDYNQVLPIFPPLDSATAKANATDLEDVVKKASFPIQWHKNSKWIDDSYVLIGKVRYYQLNFGDAAKTFRYVNSSSKDPDARHEALVWLMRTFLVTEELDNALAVSEYLKKERLNKENARELYLARAQYAYLQSDTASMIENLRLSLPNFEEKDALARTRFSLARLYQLTNQPKEAYAQYNKVLRRNPPYDLGFFSRLYIGQVSELTDTQDRNRIAGFYQKLLKDSKNTEYRDKILYEMAQFELRQQHYDKALEHLQASLKTTGSLQNQKAYSYLLAGKIYFEHLNKYNLAQAYYDSAAQVYPQNAPDYAAVVERSKVLTDFATQYNTIVLQDSLLRLARLSEPERMQAVQTIVKQEEEQRVQKEQLQQNQQLTQQRQNVTVNSNQNNIAIASTSSTGIWYFDNPAAMATARSEFVRRWGDRPLQDNWRLRSRGETTNQVQIAQETAITPDQPVISAEERTANQVQTYLQNIPQTTAAIQQAEKQVEEAMFTLGNIYSQKLKAPARATETFEQLLKRFPNTEHAAETYYSLYLLYDRAGDERKNIYYAKLKQQFPGSTYAQLVDDPSFLSKNAAENVKARILYDSAYTYYEQQKYKEASNFLAQLDSQYPLNDISDKAAFLGVMITARTEKPQALREHLQRFKSGYPKSPLQVKADQLLATYTDLEQKNLLRQEAPQVKRPDETAKSVLTITPEEKASIVIAPETQKEESIVTPRQEEKKEAQAQNKQSVKQGQPDTSTAALPKQPVASDSTATDTATANKTAPIDVMAYTSAPDTAYYFVLIYPTAAPAFKDITAKYEKYNSSFYKNESIKIDSAAFTSDKTMLVMRSFSDYKTARSFNIKQKAPQAPVGRIRGVEFTTFVISSANYSKFLQKKDLEAYLTFLRTNY